MKNSIIAGNVGNTPEIRLNKDGKEFASFSIAAKVGKRTDWVQVTCNGALVDIVRNYVQKGASLVVSGLPSVSAYINKDGIPVGIEKLFADKLEILSSKKSDISESSSNDTTTVNAEGGVNSTVDESEEFV
jgi:single-stranded DNA-binding protein